MTFGVTRVTNQLRFLGWVDPSNTRRLRVVKRNTLGWFTAGTCVGVEQVVLLRAFLVFTVVSRRWLDVSSLVGVFVGPSLHEV